MSLKKSLRIVDACLASDLDDVSHSKAGYQKTMGNTNNFQNGKGEIESRILEEDSMITDSSKNEKITISGNDANAYKLKEKQKILSYIIKTEKNIEVQKSNILQQKKAMQKAFSSGAGLGQTKRGDKSDCARKKSNPDTIEKRSSQIEPTSRENGNILTTLLSFFAYLFRAFLSFFVSSRATKRRNK